MIEYKTYLSWGVATVELIYSATFKTREEAQRAIFEYIEVFYNRIRIHSANDYLSSVEHERQYVAA